MKKRKVSEMVEGEDVRPGSFIETAEIPDKAWVQCYFSRNRDQVNESPVLLERHASKTSPDEYQFTLTGRMYNLLQKHPDQVLAVPGVFDSPDTVVRVYRRLKEGDPIPPLRLIDAMVRAELIEAQDGIMFRSTDEYVLIYHAIRGAREFFEIPQARQVVIYHKEVKKFLETIERVLNGFRENYMRENHISEIRGQPGYGPGAVKHHLELRIKKAKAVEHKSLKGWRAWLLTPLPHRTYYFSDCRALFAWKSDTVVRNVWYEVMNHAGYPMGDDYREMQTASCLEPLMRDFAILVSVDKLPPWHGTGNDGDEREHPLSNAVAELPISFATFSGMITHAKLLLELKQLACSEAIARFDRTMALLLREKIGWPTYRLAQNIEEERANAASKDG